MNLLSTIYLLGLRVLAAPAAEPTIKEPPPTPFFGEDGYIGWFQLILLLVLVGLVAFYFYYKKKQQDNQ